MKPTDEEGCVHTYFAVECCGSGCSAHGVVTAHRPKGTDEPSGLEMPDGWVLVVANGTPDAFFVACPAHAAAAMEMSGDRIRRILALATLLSNPTE